MEAEKLQQLQNILGYSWGDERYFRQAVTHTSYAFEHDAGDEHYQRLEFLGDAVLGLLLAEQLYQVFPGAAEGDLSRFRAALAGEAALARVARSCQLGSFIRLGRGERQSDGADKDSLLADILEALIAAVYLDGGIEAARSLVLRWFGELLKMPLEVAVSADAKSALQELLSSRKHPTPEYCQTAETGPPHERTYSFAVLVDNETIGSGSGRSKKIAQQAAAADALQLLLKD